MRTIALLGSTGSIGLSTLDLVRRFPERFKVYGLVAGENLKRLVSQIKEFAPQLPVIMLTGFGVIMHATGESPPQAARRQSSGGALRRTGGGRGFHGP